MYKHVDPHLYIQPIPFTGHKFVLQEKMSFGRTNRATLCQESSQLTKACIHILLWLCLLTQAIIICHYLIHTRTVLSLVNISTYISWYKCIMYMYAHTKSSFFSDTHKCKKVRHWIAIRHSRKISTNGDFFFFMWCHLHYKDDP